jgi:tetratricopeptide (TPR) repeat protein
MRYQIMSELRLETLSMPAAELGPENPLPPLRTGQELHVVDEVDPAVPAEMLKNIRYGRVDNILPYSIQDGYGRDRIQRDFKVAILENEILKATFLLEFGGRLWSLYHKQAQRELLYVNPVFQPANLALRNAWFSGGVEWNIGTIGHSPFTCAPIHVARFKSPDGTPILRMFEWERIRQVPFQIDAFLPDGSEVLFVRVRISNPHNREIPMYWWSNIAVTETPKTRVLIPADMAYRFSYDQLKVIPVPEYEQVDITYPSRIRSASDYFFHIPDHHRPWITALDEAGKGLVQVSTQRLKGRKLFVWGMDSGGRKWQEFLSGPGQAYLEIQAGLARTQLEHIPMPANTEWSWTEAYGLLEADPSAVHGSNWELAQKSVEDALGQLISREALETVHLHGEAFQDQAPNETLQHGSGWGALESLRREREGQPAFSTSGMLFDEESLTTEQAPWISLVMQGVMPDVDPDSVPAAFMIQDDWKARLEAFVKSGQHTNWITWLQLGVMRYAAKNRDGARQAWEQSLQQFPTAWARRNLAILALEDGQQEEVASLYIEAVRMKPELLPLVVECGQALLKSMQPQKWLELLKEVPATIRSSGRIQLLEAQAALAIGDFKKVEQFFANEFILPTIREGELSLSDFWFEYHLKRLSYQENREIDDELRARVYREFPVPAHIDFRMKIEPHEQS